MNYGYAIFIQEGDVAFPYWFTERHRDGISDGKALAYASPKIPLRNLKQIRSELPIGRRVVPDEIHVRRIRITPRQADALAEAAAKPEAHRRIWVGGWRNRAEAAATWSERVCEHDTDGDGDCHLCAKSGRCRLETRSQQGTSAT